LRGEGSCRRPTPPSIHPSWWWDDGRGAWWLRRLFFYSYFFLFLRLEYLILPLVDKIFFSFYDDQF
jgi:hypothetical protein